MFAERKEKIISSFIVIGLTISLLVAGPSYPVAAADPGLYLADLIPVGYEQVLGEYQYIHIKSKVIKNQTYDKSFCLDWNQETGSEEKLEFQLGYNYENLKALAGVSDGSESDYRGRAAIYGDGVLLFDSGSLGLWQTQDVNIPLTNVMRLEIRLSHTGEGRNVNSDEGIVLASPFITIKDTTKPNVRVSVPLLSSDTSTSTQFPVTYSVSDPAPASGIASWKLEIREGANGTWSEWRTGTTGISATDYFMGTKGKTYYFRVSAVDQKGNSATSSEAVITVPLDQNSMKYSLGWAAQKNKRFYGGSIRKSKRKGAWAVCSFSGSEVYVIACKNSWSGRADTYVDGIYQKTVELYSPSKKYRQTVFSKSLPDGNHTIKIVVKGTKSRRSSNTWVELDAIGVKK